MDYSQSEKESTSKCSKCNDLGYVILAWEGAGLASECECMEMKRMMKRFNSAMIPDEFKGATFADYKRLHPVHDKLYNESASYLNTFGQTVVDENGIEKGNSLGFIAVYGEQKINKLPPERKAEMKRLHNSYGLGKTHLQVAIAKHLIKKGYAVLMVSDVDLMDELMANKRDNKKAFDERMQDLIQVPVLIWDDIGKSVPSEAKKSAYFHIINERYKAKRPIIYSSNEDKETLEDRIGGAATSRLFGMSYGRINQVEGPDYRLMGNKAV